VRPTAALRLAGAIGTIVNVDRRQDEVAHLLHRAEALRRVAGDIGSRLDLDRILAGLVDHAMVLFEGDRAAVFLQRPDGRAVAEVSRGLSAEYLTAVREFPPRSLPTAAITARRPLFSIGTAMTRAGQGPRHRRQEGSTRSCRRRSGRHGILRALPASIGRHAWADEAHYDLGAPA
jgi:hypothetical protein